MTSSQLTPLDLKKLEIINNYFNNITTDDIELIIYILEPSKKPKKPIKKISLRFLEWFVINYCKHNQIIINKHTGEQIKENINEINLYLSNNNTININENYNLQIKIHSKDYFDSFKRQKRIEYKFNNNQKIITTIAQLNFLKWIFENNIITYIINNYDELHLLFKKYSVDDRKKKQRNKINKETNNKLLESTTESSLSYSSISISPNSLSITI